MKKLSQKIIARMSLFSVMMGALLFPLQYSLAFSQIGSQMDLGARGNDVISLQTYLAASPSLYPEGLITGYFGPLTRAAVIRFQLANGLPGVGRVGPLTISKLNSLIGGGVSFDLAAPTIYNVGLNTYAPSASLPLSGTAVVSWTTTEPASAKVFYNTSPLSTTEAQADRTEPFISGSMMSDLSLSTTKSITLPNLSVNATYYYMIESIDALGNVSVWGQNNFVAK